MVTSSQHIGLAADLGVEGHRLSVHFCLKGLCKFKTFNTSVPHFFSIELISCARIYTLVNANII